MVTVRRCRGVLLALALPLVGAVPSSAQDDSGVSLDPGGLPSGSPGPIAGRVDRQQGETCTFIDFEGLGDNQEIGTVSGEPNVTFATGWLALIDADAGGSGNFANEPSPDTVAYVPAGAYGPIDFDEGVQFAQFFYVASAISLPVTLTAFDGPGGTGNEVDSVQGDTIGTDFDGAPCTGDPSGNFCLFDILTLAADTNNIRSVVISGAVPNQFAFDDMEYCTFIPPAPLAPTWAWALLAVLIAGGAAWRLRRRVA